MRRSIYSDQQIHLFVQDLAEGRPAQEICRVAGVSQRTLYRWRRKFEGLKPFAVQALRQLEQENRRLRAAAVRTAGNAPAGRPLAASRSVRSDMGSGGSGGGLPGPATVVGRYAALRLR